MIAFLAEHANLNARLELSLKEIPNTKSTLTSVLLVALAPVFARLEPRRKHNNHHKTGKTRGCVETASSFLFKHESQDFPATP